MPPVPADRATLAALVAEIDGFYVRDRRMRAAQTAMKRALSETTDPSDADAERYLDAVKKYFDGFAREARAHLTDVDRRLAKVSQLQFNLTAERGVAARRVEVTQGVLTRVLELARR
jgi:hypothetical protein